MAILDYTAAFKAWAEYEVTQLYKSSSTSAILKERIEKLIAPPIVSQVTLNGEKVSRNDLIAKFPGTAFGEKLVTVKIKDTICVIKDQPSVVEKVPEGLVGLFYSVTIASKYGLMQQKWDFSLTLRVVPDGEIHQTEFEAQVAGASTGDDEESLKLFATEWHELAIKTWDITGPHSELK